MASNDTNIRLPELPIEDPYFINDTYQKPVIAAVNGIAVGGGFWLTMQADLRVAAESAYFQISELLRGIPTGVYPAEFWIARENLPYVIQAELLSGMKLDARRAYEVGFVNKIVPDGQVLEAAREMAEQFISVPPLAPYYNLKLFRRLRRAQSGGFGGFPKAKFRYPL